MQNEKTSQRTVWSLNTRSNQKPGSKCISVLECCNIRTRLGLRVVAPGSVMELDVTVADRLNFLFIILKQKSPFFQ